jgi:hypothetical protein
MDLFAAFIIAITCELASGAQSTFLYSFVTITSLADARPTSLGLCVDNRTNTPAHQKKNKYNDCFFFNDKICN